MQGFLRFMLAGMFAFSAITADFARAITVNIDYTYDTSNFFGAGNPHGAAAGAQAQASLEAAADFFSTILTDTFSSIQTPADFHSSVFNGVISWEWQLSFTNPSTGGSTTLIDQTIASDEYRIYVGARSLSGNTLGVGGPGGWSIPAPTQSGLFTQPEVNQIDAIHNNFVDAVSNRGETSGFASWGGALTFDSDAGTNWHYDHIGSPSGGESDFFSVAIHELAHSLGLGASTEWNNLVSGTSFLGAASQSEYGGPVPLDCDGTCGHWAEGTTSNILGTTTSQEASMDPTISSGQRKRLTELDAAALTDLGWSVSTPTYSPSDYDLDGDVDAVDLARIETWYGVNGNADADGDGDSDGADFLLWQQNYTGPLSPAFGAPVPEPGTLALLLVGTILCRTRRCRN